MFGFLTKTQLVAVDCLTGRVSKIEQSPFEIGKGQGVDLKLEPQGVADRHCTVLQVKGKNWSLVKQEPTLQVLVDGESVESWAFAPETDYAIRIGANFLALRYSKEIEKWLRGLDFSQWTLHDHDDAAGRVDGPMYLEQLCQFAKSQQRHPRCRVRPQGLNKGFFLQDAFEVLAARQAAEAAIQRTVAEEEEVVAVVETGSLTCPYCWRKFGAGDIMHVAVHDTLRGDPILGEDAQQRFLATRFNEMGQALDAMGLPSTDMACPRCRQILPQGFTEMHHHIISIVGDQSAGKSYYLSVLLKMLPASLFSQYSVVFQDINPAGNAIINQMKQALFGSKTPEGARLRKTDLNGDMYVKVPRDGRMVPMPRPFVFSAAAAADLNRCCSLIFYDNAGENFQPGRDSAESPGAQHVASSSGILFLFDPFNSPDFRQKIADINDPQLQKPAVDQQSIILSEMRVRIAKLLRSNLRDKINTPMAVMVGKCDAWIHLLGEEPLRNPVHPDGLALGDVRANSDRVRQFLLNICPEVVANAESISHNIMYFAVSSFGHAPVTVKVATGDDTKSDVHVPDPRRLKPFQVEVPMLWVMSSFAGDLVPSRKGPP